MPITKPSDRDVMKAVGALRKARRRSDAEIRAAVAADPEAAPTQSRASIARKLRAGAIRRVPAVNSAAIRRKLGLSQSKFAATFGISLRTVQEWEQGRAEPQGPARALLTLIDREPEAARRALTQR
jgi:putative transcriptional regulator